MKSKFLGITLVLLCAGAAFAQEWPQWALNAQHNTQSSILGQALNRNIVNIVYDPLVPDEQAAALPYYGSADLLVHYQAPLVDGNDTYMMFKSGPYSFTDNSTQTWGETKFSWTNGTLAQQWQFTSDWKAAGSQLDFWEPVFHPALANGSLYVPGFGGTIWRVNKLTGTGVRINPFSGPLDGSKYEAGSLTVDAQGRVLYNVIQLKNGTKDFYADDIIDSFLIRVSPDNSIEKVSYSTLTVGAPLGKDQCSNAFSASQLPWPPSPTAVPPTVTCGTQRPGMNSSLTVAPDGTIYTATRAHLISREAYIVAINSNLTQKWISTMRDRMNDGCGVPVSQGGSLPPNGAPGGCRAGANIGVDPATNRPGGGRIFDDQSSTVVVAPDGTLWYGAFTRYNYDQGHIMKFSSSGAFLGSYRFGWDDTPGIYQHGSTYSVVTKDNQYGGIGSYCDNDTYCPPDRDSASPDYPEAYYITQLNKNLNVEWRFQSTNTQSCSRDANGNVTCVSDHPKGFEWCVNAFVVDSAGYVYANSEDGNLYKIAQGALSSTHIFQQLAVGAAYTPTSIGSDGKIYSQNAGHLFVAGN
jgi:hypothetical protein